MGRFRSLPNHIASFHDHSIIASNMAKYRFAGEFLCLLYLVEGLRGRGVGVRGEEDNGSGGG